MKLPIFKKEYLQEKKDLFDALTEYPILLRGKDTPIVYIYPSINSKLKDVILSNLVISPYYRITIEEKDYNCILNTIFAVSVTIEGSEIYTYAYTIKDLLTAYKKSDKLHGTNNTYIYNKISKVIRDYRSEYVINSKHELLVDNLQIKGTPMKIGKLLKYLFSEVTNKQIENVIKNLDLYKNFESKVEFEEVKGEGIKYYYNSNNYYFQQGTLGNSCMRHDHLYKELELYTTNPNNISLIICKVKGEPKKILGRALLWNNHYIDRVYSNNSQSEAAINQYAKNKGYINIYNSDVKTDIELENYSQPCYPYLDSFKYKHPKIGIFSNSWEEGLESTRDLCENSNLNVEPIINKSISKVFKDTKTFSVYDMDDFYKCKTITDLNDYEYVYLNFYNKNKIYVSNLIKSNDTKYFIPIPREYKNKLPKNYKLFNIDFFKSTFLDKYLLKRDCYFSTFYKSILPTVFKQFDNFNSFIKDTKELIAYVANTDKIELLDDEIQKFKGNVVKVLQIAPDIYKSGDYMFYRHNLKFINV